MEANNMKAMRHALETISDMAKCDRNPTTDSILEIVRRALVAQPRNCDVGTAEEQTQRMRSVCLKYKPTCVGCKCYGDIQKVNCWLAWAQMPYEGGGAK